MNDKEYKIYLKGFMDGVNDQSERFKSSAFRAKHDSDLLDKVAEKIREHSGLHYVDCDGYFGGIEELIFKVDDWLDDIIAEMKAGVSECELTAEREKQIGAEAITDYIKWYCKKNGYAPLEYFAEEYISEQLKEQENV